MFAARCRGIVKSAYFQHTITGVIIFAGILVGLQSYEGVVLRYGTLLDILDWLVLSIFVAEVAIKMAAHGRRPYRYFLEPWNIFDFTIVAICLLPVQSQFVAVFRLARILRVMRLVSAVPRLQMLVGALLTSIPSIGYIAGLLGLLFYVYAVIGTNLFGVHDPVNFGTLHIALVTLFRIVTLDNWTDVMYLEMYGTPTPHDSPELVAAASLGLVVGVPIYFISFIMIGSMIILNLFIGVIMTAMNEMQDKQTAADLKKRKAATKIITMQDQSEDLVNEIQALEAQLKLIRMLYPDAERSEHDASQSKYQGKNRRPTI